MLMDGVAVTASADCVVGANVAIGTMEPLNTESSMTTIACDNPHPSSPFLSSGHHGVAPAGLLVDDVRITSDFRIDDTEHTFALTPAVEPDHSLAPTSSYGQPRSARPNISADTARIVDLMLSESSEEVMLTDISDDPEILPQHLLDDLLEILSDEDINELNQHQ
ncbi:hypothetical protein PHYBOEH_008719 [Phytophthora boehmeriae]|uniref:Uncharacterized protein n=1 Tax=Phytophthora boehmeriae TaxID=109152 RepID=A0A8T1X2K2_9STRA|nr:hypothetical protein PHYBOEH_008719 [Phytophthora boehmeriae]